MLKVNPFYRRFWLDCINAGSAHCSVLPDDQMTTARTFTCIEMFAWATRQFVLKNEERLKEILKDPQIFFPFLKKKNFSLKELSKKKKSKPLNIKREHIKKPKP